MTTVKVVSPAQWLAARKELLVKEADAARARAELSASRRELPVQKADKDYVFEGASGKASLGDLFEGRQQLIIYHFMFDPSWDAGCKHCSLLVDNLGHLSHLHARHTTMALVSRAPWSKIEPFRARMGWPVPWYSSFDSDFNYDYHTTLDGKIAPVEYNYQAGGGDFTDGEASGLSTFIKEDGEIYHSYSSYDGEDVLYGTFNYLDLTYLGPQEEDRSWLRHHDKYGV